MSLFNKIEIKPEMEAFIARGEGVGIVKVDNYGKASARIESYKIILESYDEEYPIIESIAAISYLSYDPGNFFQEPKLEIGLGQKEYTLAGVDNNDDELEAFYKSILSIKNKEKKQKPNTNNVAPKIQDKQNGDYDELDEIEEEFSSKPMIKDTTNKIRGFLSKRFEDKEEKETPQEDMISFKEDKRSIQEEQNNSQEEESSKIKQFINKKSEKPNDLEVILDEEEFIEDDDEEIIFFEDEQEVEKPPKEEIKVQKEVEKEEIEDIKEYDEFDEFDEIDDFEELDDFEVDEEIILEEDPVEETQIIEDTDELISFDDTVEEPVEIKKPTPQPISDEPKTSEKVAENTNGINKIKNQVLDWFTEEADDEQPTVQETQNLSNKNLKQPTTKTTPKVEVPTKNETELGQEISQVKQQVNEDIDNINQQIITQKTENESTDTFDPVYQIRRYYKLKEEGIITEEEFNQKKKQLLEL